MGEACSADRPASFHGSSGCCNGSARPRPDPWSAAAGTKGLPTKESSAALDKVLRNAALAFTGALDQGSVHLCFGQWKGLLWAKQRVKLERRERVMLSCTWQLASRVSGQTLAMVLAEWRELARKGLLVRMGFVRVREPFRLKTFDEVCVDRDRSLVKRLCEGGSAHQFSGGWRFEKGRYLGEKGVVIGRDWVGLGVRVLFPDGRWWSYAPEALHVRILNLDPQRRALLLVDDEQDERPCGEVI
eukprot:TRINITY_DN74828_c0_g1_i1.p1 TRINITY_DN74828_c0_g1~~TRINITY_DN74828_c0_g1_i1.p1  ORF type:complete len:266 (-),score=51.46 TRINITY_DN74828_c0_g1_i1:274-1005(-)